VRKQIGYTSCKLIKNADLESDLLLNLQTHLVDLLRDSDLAVRQKIVDKLGEKILKYNLIAKISQMLFDEYVSRVMDKEP